MEDTDAVKMIMEGSYAVRYQYPLFVWLYLSGCRCDSWFNTGRQ